MPADVMVLLGECKIPIIALQQDYAAAWVERRRVSHLVQLFEDVQACVSAAIHDAAQSYRRQAATGECRLTTSAVLPRLLHERRERVRHTRSERSIRILVGCDVGSPVVGCDRLQDMVRVRKEHQLGVGARIA